LAHGHRWLYGSSLLGLLHSIQIAGVCTLLRKCLSLLLDDCLLLGLCLFKLTLAAHPVLDGLQLVRHLHVGRCSGRRASELERTLGWVEHRDSTGRWRLKLGFRRYHSSGKFLCGELSTKHI
jgi:hypothetical protein